MSLIRRPALGRWIHPRARPGWPRRRAQDLPVVFPPSGNPAGEASESWTRKPAAERRGVALFPRSPRPLPPIHPGPSTRGRAGLGGRPPNRPGRPPKRKDRPHFFDYKTQFRGNGGGFQGKTPGLPRGPMSPDPWGAALYEHGKIMTAQRAPAGPAGCFFQYDFIDGTSEAESSRSRPACQVQPRSSPVSPYSAACRAALPGRPCPGRSVGRYAVLAKLATSPSPLPSDRVLVGVPTPHGMSRN